jgi:hypothetical protein
VATAPGGRGGARGPPGPAPHTQTPPTPRRGQGPLCQRQLRRRAPPRQRGEERQAGRRCPGQRTDRPDQSGGPGQGPQPLRGVAGLAPPRRQCPRSRLVDRSGRRRDLR